MISQSKNSGLEWLHSWRKTIFYEYLSKLTVFARFRKCLIKLKLLGSCFPVCLKVLESSTSSILSIKSFFIFRASFLKTAGQPSLFRCCPRKWCKNKMTSAKFRSEKKLKKNISNIFPNSDFLLLVRFFFCFFSFGSYGCFLKVHNLPAFFLRSIRFPHLIVPQNFSIKRTRHVGNTVFRRRTYTRIEIK